MRGAMTAEKYLDSATVSPDQHTDAYGGEQAAIHGPLRLTGHEAPREDVDALEEPDAPHQQTQGTDDVQCDPHSQWKVDSWLRTHGSAYFFGATVFRNAHTDCSSTSVIVP